MELAKVTSKDQITVPSEIRRKLKLRTGDKVVFTEEDGKIVFRNASLTALSEIQEEMRGPRRQTWCLLAHTGRRQELLHGHVHQEGPSETRWQLHLPDLNGS